MISMRESNIKIKFALENKDIVYIMYNFLQEIQH